MEQQLQFQSDQDLCTEISDIINFLSQKENNLLDQISNQQALAIGFILGSKDGNLYQLQKLVKLVLKDQNVNIQKQNKSQNYLDMSLDIQPLNKNLNKKRHPQIFDKLDNCLDQINLEEELNMENNKKQSSQTNNINNSNNSNGVNERKVSKQIKKENQKVLTNSQKINNSSSKLQLDQNDYQAIQNLIKKEKQEMKNITPSGNNMEEEKPKYNNNNQNQKFYLDIQQQNLKEKQRLDDEEFVKQLIQKEKQDLIQKIEEEKKMKQKEDEQLLLMLEKEKMEEENKNKLKCEMCKENIDDHNDIVQHDNCAHMYHTLCFQILYKEIFLENIKKNENIKLLGLEDQEQQIKIKQVCKSFCGNEFNLFDYKNLFEEYKQLAKQNRENMFLCQICFKYQNQDKKRILDCEHEFCGTCLTEYVQNLHKKNQAYLCNACRKPIDEMYIEDLIPEQDQVDFKAEISEALQKDRMLETALELCNGDKEQAQQIINDGNFLEIGAVMQLDQCQKDALTYVAKLAQVQSKKALPSLEKKFEKLGYPRDLVSNVLKYIRDEAPITINFKLAHLQKYIESGCYKNLFEIQNMGQQHGNGGRFGWESNLFGKKYNNAKPKQRVKYGALNIYNNPQGIPQCIGYGKNYFVMKEVRLRTTFYDRDTGGFPQNRYLATSQHYAHILNDFTDQELTAVIEIALKQKHYDPINIGTYKEIQIHGPVEFGKHVQIMFYNVEEGYQYKKQIEEFSKKFGVDCIPIEK